MPAVRYHDFRAYLRRRLPEARPLLAAMEAEEAEDAAEAPGMAPADAYGVMSVIFWWGVFEPALRAGDERLAAECFGIVEELMRDADENLAQVLYIRVLEWLMAEWREQSARLGGELLRDLVEATS
ncbi:hypothetical protein [[Actinomadura] parvosata]|uniref:hypothetical protein n=1 Tax=[Actinomadura] parvosata TaxID=1955412 RepID=UPI0012BB8CD4|nr:hypothetical protein [Nonomuraea sp. ATCC 55076]